MKGERRGLLEVGMGMGKEDQELVIEEGEMERLENRHCCICVLLV